MNNKDLIRQYVDTGLELPEYQINQLPNNLLRTYLRKRIISVNRNNGRMLRYYELKKLTPDELNQYLANGGQLDLKTLTEKSPEFRHNYFAQVLAKKKYNFQTEEYSLFSNENMKQFVNNGSELTNNNLDAISEDLRKIYLSARAKRTDMRFSDKLEDYEFKYAMHYPDILKDYIDHAKKLPTIQFNQLDKNILPYYFKVRATDLVSEYSDIEDYEFERMDDNTKQKLMQDRFNLSMNDKTEAELNDTEFKQLNEKQQKQFLLKFLSGVDRDVDYEDRKGFYEPLSDDIKEMILNWVIERGQELEDDEINFLNPKLKIKYIKTQLKKGNDIPNYLMSWYNNWQNHEQ